MISFALKAGEVLNYILFKDVSIYLFWQKLLWLLQESNLKYIF